jgi:hypothetical protein
LRIADGVNYMDAIRTGQFKPGMWAAIGRHASQER